MSVRKQLATELRSYINKKHNQDECIGFVDGFERACDLIDELKSVVSIDFENLNKQQL